MNLNMNLNLIKRSKPSHEPMPANERQQLLAELRQAHGDWLHAQHRLDWVVEKDQIDYAIFALEAAEKKYEMLLRQAKQLSWNVTHIAHGSSS